MQEKEIRWKTSFLLLSICLCFSIFLISCDKPEIPDFKPALDITPGDISDKLVARIYFDATLSMQGFVVPGSTRYTQICPYLESVVVTGWEDETVNFFRFGEQVEPINRSTYLQAGYESFYEQAHIFRRTYIEEVIRHEEKLVNAQMKASSTPEDATEADVNDTPEATIEGVTPTETVNERRKEGQLIVIVTDLFQDDSDITLLIDYLKKKYIQKGSEVGLFGLRSQFDGTVYDIGIGEESSLRYRSNPSDLETFRPFYLLVLGRYADIVRYFDLLKANNPDAQTIIFSRYLVSSLLSIDGDSVKPEVNNLNSDTFKSVPARVKQFRIVDDSKLADISTKLAYTPLRHAMFFDSDTFGVSIRAKDKLMGETKENPDAKNCLKVTPTLQKNENGSEFTVDFKLDSQSLPRKAIYLYEVTLHPNVDKYQAPEWCSRWDMGAERDGSKTLNLVNFVRNLSQVTARMHRPKIAQFHFYIEKR